MGDFKSYFCTIIQLWHTGTKREREANLLKTSLVSATRTQENSVFSIIGNQLDHRPLHLVACLGAYVTLPHNKSRRCHFICLNNLKRFKLRNKTWPWCSSASWNGRRDVSQVSNFQIKLELLDIHTKIGNLLLTWWRFLWVSSFHHRTW